MIRNGTKARARETEEKPAVLIVEDEAPIRETLREFLLGKGYGVSVARSGEEAEDLLRGDGRFGIVLTDLRLPMGDGVEVLRLAREVNPSGYVVLMTGFASLESAIEAVRLGAFEYLVKPFSLTELDLTLERVSEHRKLSHTNERLSGELEKLRPFLELDQQQEGLRRALEELAGEIREQRAVLERLAERLEPNRPSAALSEK